MNDSREAVLSGIRQSLGRGPLTSGEQDRLDSGVHAQLRHTRPRFDDEPVRRFVNGIAGRGATVAEVGSLAEAGAAVAAYLDGLGLPRQAAAAPALAGLAWPEGFDVRFGRADKEDRVGVTPCFAAVAETGSLVLLSGPATPVTLNFVPENHLVIVRKAQIVRYLEDAWARLRARPEGMPRTVNVIAGPSRTADVEQTIQLGAHGPRRLHVILVNETQQP